MEFGSIAGSDYYGTVLRGEHKSIVFGTKIWCVNIGEYMVFGSIVGSDYYLHH